MTTYYGLEDLKKIIVPAGGNWSPRLPSWFSGRCLLNGDGGPAVQMITMMMIMMIMIVVTMLVTTMTVMNCAFKILKVSSS